MKYNQLILMLTAVEDAVAIDLREIFPEARGEAMFKAVVK